MTPEHFAALKADFLAALRDKEDLFVQDLFGGSQPEHRVRVRVDQRARLAQSVHPHAAGPARGARAARLRRPNTRSSTCRASAPIPRATACRSETVIAVNFTEKLILIGGTALCRRDEEVGVRHPQLSAAADRRDADALLGQHRRRRRSTAVFFGLSGTGKTTLSRRRQPHADRRRRAWLVRHRGLQLRGRLLRQDDPPVGRGRAGDLRDHQALRHGARERRDGSR